jgi:hypothetical protein
MKRVIQGSSSCGFRHRVLKGHVFATEPVVDSSEGLQLVLHVVPLLWVQEDLKEQKIQEYSMMLHWLAQPSIFISNNSRIFKKWKCSDHLRFSVHPEDTGKRQNTFMILAPSKRYLTCLPTISAGYTTSPKIPSWTTVRVLVRGRWTAEPFLGGLTILLVAIITTSCEKWKTQSIQNIPMIYNRSVTQIIRQ